MRIKILFMLLNYNALFFNLIGGGVGNLRIFFIISSSNRQFFLNLHRKTNFHVL